MIRLSSAAVIALMCMSSASAETQKEKFDRIDTNRDGLVSYDEHSADLDAEFRTIDANGDRVISIAEYASYLSRKTPGAPAPALQSVARCFLTTVKPKNDGTLSQADWKNFNDRVFRWLADGADKMTFEQSKRVPPPEVIPRPVCH